MIKEASVMYMNLIVKRRYIQCRAARIQCHYNYGTIKYVYGSDLTGSCKVKIVRNKAYSFEYVLCAKHNKIDVKLRVNFPWESVKLIRSY